MLPEGKVVVYTAEKVSNALGAGAVRLEVGVERCPDGTGDVVTVSPALGMHGACPWWFVTDTKVASEANVAEVIFKVANVAGVDPVKHGGGISALAAGLVAEDVRSTSVLVPILVNTCALAAGTVLKRFAVRTEKPKDPKAITAAQVAKRARLS